MKVGNSPKMSPTEADGNSPVQSNSSWRQAILNRVVTPGKDHEKENDKPGNIGNMKAPQVIAKPRSKQELRDLWKKAINQQLILIRMEKENARLRGNQGGLSRKCITACTISIFKNVSRCSSTRGSDC